MGEGVKHYNKVFGLGLSKTGTTSLNSALNILGLKSLHPSGMEQRINRELNEGNYKLKILEKNDALTDIVTVPYYKNFDKTYPGSKFILTIRDKDKWLDSVELHWSRYLAGRKFPKKPLKKMVILKVWGTDKFHRSNFTSVYDKHINDVLGYFKNRAEDLLIMNICGGDGWDKLCPFLGVDTPSDLFPSKNKS